MQTSTPKARYTNLENPIMHMLNTNLEITELDSATIRNFDTQLTGRIITPGSDDYDEARAVWNGMIANYPALIVRCATNADVATTVNFARENDLLISVRGGGHNVAGSAVRNGGLVIDLTDMRGVTVDPIAKTATAQGGATLADLDAATQQYALATPGGVFSETGIGGLTLGGGVGWMRRKHGLTCDNLIGATVVTSAGEIIRANDATHPDLMWALRGGGGQFGVVTAFTYQLHPVGPLIMFTFVLHPGENAAAALRFFRTYIADAPNEISAMAVLGHVPPSEHFPEEAHGRPFVLFCAAYIGEVETGRQMLAPLINYDTPLADMSGVMPFTEVQKMFDEDYPSGELHYYWKGVYMQALSDAAIEMLVEANDAAPSIISTIDVWHMGGAINDFDDTTSAFAEREAQFLIGIEANWDPAEDDDANVSWVKNTAVAAEPFGSKRRYLNFPGFFEEENLLEAMFGQNGARIAEVKAQYDPINLFRLK